MVWGVRTIFQSRLFAQVLVSTMYSLVTRYAQLLLFAALYSLSPRLLYTVLFSGQ